MRHVLKGILLPAALLALAAFAAGQSAADASRKGKDGGEAGTAPKGVVVTNADLAKTKKKPAVSFLPRGETPPAGDNAAASPEGAEAGAPKISIGTDKPPLGFVSNAGGEKTAKQLYDERKAELARIWAAAKERIDLLNIKMLGLRQQMNAGVLPGVRDQAQVALAETAKTLLEAQDAEKKAREELDRFTSGGKSGV
jgi:hypothetical protein